MVPMLQGAGRLASPALPLTFPLPSPPPSLPPFPSPPLLLLHLRLPSLTSAALALASASSASADPPSFVFILTDDQDVLLGGLEAMPYTRTLIQEQGMTFENGFVSTPICCPSRTSTLSGLYGHNLGQQATQDWCGNFTGHAIENATWISRLGENGYLAGLSGKYHNAPPQGFVPKGWSDFFSLNAECLYFNNSFNDNGKTVHFGDAATDYMTALIGNRSLAFLSGAIAAKSPFLAYIAPHAPHMPAEPAPWYANASLPSYIAPRTPQYNASGVGKHWVIADQEPITDVLEAGIDDIFRRRHRALLSVDDIVREVVALLEGAGRLDNTYFIYTSDHGYNLGTMRLPVEKFHLLESDIRVPFLVRGPGVPKNSTSTAIVANIDIGATILDLAGLPPAETPTDGQSFASVLVPGRGGASASAAAAPARDRLVIEYGRWGTGYITRGACGIGCGICDPALSRLVDAPSNTYSALRIINATHNLVYGEFAPGSTEAAGPASTNWTELYDFSADPWGFTNLALQPGKAPLVAELSAELWEVALCKGAACP
jgi:N-acetylglucosamine-6-sulfatase